MTEEQHVINYNITDAALAELAERHKDVDAHQNYPLAKSAAKECQKLRKGLETKRVALKADALEWGRKVDDEAKRIKAAIVAVEDPIKEQIKEIDDAAATAEAERVERIEISIAYIRAFGHELDLFTSSDLAKHLEDLEAWPIDDANRFNYEEFQTQAEGAKAESASLIRIAMRKATEREEEAAKLEAQRLAQAEQQRKLDEQQAAIDAQQEKLAKEQFERDEMARADREEADRVKQQELDAQSEKQRIAQDIIDVESKRLQDIADEETAEALRQEDEAAVRARAPDIEKLRGYLAFISVLEVPEMTSSEGLICSAQVKFAVDAMVENMENLITKEMS